MKNYVLGTVIAAILIAVIAVAGVSQLRGGDGSEEASRSEASPQEVPQRPDCPAGTVAGVELECLGGAAAGKPADEGIAVVKDGEVRKQFAQPFSSAAEIEKAVEEAIAA